ncbi:Scr1 family TA system antitoxin-like transcriptional regulator [Streptomyces sp. JV185]|uniref:Scr1 family TA system antitoxin-like transcriptional regulator n=1 Tax=Streptomyces sp. JV185 TaxID=858638 RepID=UPI002E77D6EF|nr:Scr1 family TA system antitoxin-like transcriptional regulator [Streptomyces sp. JV185]MEE1770390.1 Scr1 family TA system antitoxin-like transcriptional regulator [Streptomyces sp. JV185]
MPARREQIQQGEATAGLGLRVVQRDTAAPRNGAGVRVMPLDSTAHPGVVGGFSMVGFPGPAPDVVLLENLSGETYLEGEEASPFAKAFERIRATALSTEDSVARIAEMEEGHRK